MQKQKFFYAVFVTFLALGLGLSYPGNAIGANCNSNYFSNPTDWGSVPWSCSHIPNSGDDALVGGPDPPITVTLDQDIVIQYLLLYPNATLNAGSHTITLSSATPIRIDGTFNAGTSTVKFSDANHTVDTIFTLYNWQWATPLTAPRTLTIATGITVTKAAGGTFNLNGTATYPVAFAGTGTITPALTVYYCGSSTVTGVDCQAGGPPAPDYGSTPASGSTISMTATQGTDGTSTLTVSETGNSALNVTGITVSGTDAAKFSALPANFSIADGSADQDVTITCDASAVGTFTNATLNVAHNATGSPDTYPLSCTVTAPTTTTTTPVTTTTTPVTTTTTPVTTTTTPVTTTTIPTTTTTTPVTTTTIPSGPDPGIPDTAYPVYRFYSEGLLKHLFTSDENEKAHLIADASDVWRYEGIAYYSYANANTALVPVYRFYSEALMTHLFTIDENEKAHLIADASEVWRYEGIAFYVPANYQEGTLPVYRFYSESLKVHLFTMDENEKNTLIQTAGEVWRYEGIAYYARPASAGAAFRTSADATFRPGDATVDVSDASGVIHSGDAPVILEDAEDGDTSGWTAYNGAVTVFNMPDPDSAENRVIEIPLDCADALFGFIPPQPAVASKLSWRMRFDDDYTIYAGCRTSDGNRFLVYTANPGNADYADVDDYIYIGLGDVAADGNWVTVTRDLQVDMAGAGEEAVISQIFGFYISGQGYIDDLLLPAK